MRAALMEAHARIAKIRPDLPLASALLAGEIFRVAALMVADNNGWAQLFRLKIVGAG